MRRCVWLIFLDLNETYCFVVVSHLFCVVNLYFWTGLLFPLFQLELRPWLLPTQAAALGYMETRKYEGAFAIWPDTNAFNIAVWRDSTLRTDQIVQAPFGM